MYKHLSAHNTLGMLYFVDDDACESILDKFLSIFSTFEYDCTNEPRITADE